MYINKSLLALNMHTKLIIYLYKNYFLFRYLIEIAYYGLLHLGYSNMPKHIYIEI